MTVGRAACCRIISATETVIPRCAPPGNAHLVGHEDARKQQGD